ncbi:MAG: hypothetical protein M3Z19_14715 [Chloroflexota bacterium]|nr:hypothetical protein [Chloroflexota bacterium]
MGTLEMVGARLGRRRFLMVAGTAAGSAILAACGGSSTATDTPKPSVPTTAAPTTAAPAAQVAPTAAAGSASVATRPAGSAVANATAATTAPAASTTASSTTVVGSAAVATRPAGSAVASSVSATTASGSAAAGTTSGGIQTMVIEAFDYGFRTLGSIPGGQTRVQMKNTGKEIHHAQFMLLNTGVTPDQLGAAFAKGEQGLGEVFGLVTQAGGAGVTLPGGGTEVILNLKEGQYMIACFIAGDDHIPHLAKGMLMPLKVTAAPVAASPAPAVNGTITMFDFDFTMPDTLPAGKSMYTVMNTGAQFHEFNIGQIVPGKTIGDVKAYYAATAPPAGPPPLIPMGGMNALTKGNTGIAVFDLMPGNYVAICNVPDQSKPNGDSHAHLGMIKGFTVK